MITPKTNSMWTQFISKEQLIKDLREIGIKHGDHLGVALSFRSIGYVEGGPDSFIDALLEVVGVEGTIMVPTYTRRFPLYKILKGKTNYIFDYHSTPCTTGIVPETLRKRKQALRSRHPTNSVAALGKKSRFLIDSHDERARAYLPYSRLAEIEGKILIIGLNDNLIALRHEAQFLAGLLDVVPYRCGVKFKDSDGKERLFIRKDKGGCVTTLPKLVEVFRRQGLIRDGKIGLAPSILAPAKETLETMTGMLRRNPELNLCRDISCLWCREVERRLKLYRKIEDLTFFQKNQLLIFFISIINWFRIRNSS